MESIQNVQDLSFEKVWLMFQEIGKNFRDTDKKFQDTDKKFQDTDKKFQDTDKKFQDTDKKFQDTDRIVKNLSKKMTESENRWGKFVESLVEGSLLKLLKKKNIKVERTTQRSKGIFQNKQFEIDIIATNGEELVAVEVKTTLSSDDVKRFLEKLKVFKEAFPEYSNKKIYGAVAYINTESESDKMAENKGLFVIKATNESARIVNTKDFKPKEW
jgi:hypothetical protein